MRDTMRAESGVLAHVWHAILWAAPAGEHHAASVVFSALQQVMHGHGAAVVVDVVAAPLAKTWTRWTKQAGLGGSVFLTRKAILMDSGSMKDVPLVSGMRQTLEVVGEKELSELGKYCTSCRAVT